jgi:hypothetical protein
LQDAEHLASKSDTLKCCDAIIEGFLHDIQGLSKSLAL